MQSSDDGFDAIDEDLWFGSDDPAAADRAAARSLAAEVARITGLKPFPAVARKVLLELASDEWSTARVASMMEGDPSLAGQVLKLVNSAFYAAQGRRSQSVREAVVRVGGVRVRELVMGIATLQLLDARGREARLSRDHCAATAAVARVLAGLVGAPAGPLFVAGLLHDAGRLLLLESGEVTYPTDPPPAKGQHVAIEREALGFDHAVLGGHVLRAWGVLEPVPRLVAWHHHPARAWAEGGAVATQMGVLRLADAIADAMHDGPSGIDDPTWRALAEGPESAWTGLDAPRIQSMWRMLEGARAETLAVFS